MPPSKKGKENKSREVSRTANGITYEDGQYLCIQTDNDGRVCNRWMSTRRGQISTHNGRFHNLGSYYEAQNLGPFSCVDCSKPTQDWNSLIGHHRKYHDLRGSSKPLEKKYLVQLAQLAKKQNNGSAKKEAGEKDEVKDEDKDKDKEDDDDDDDDDSMFVRDPHDHPTDKRDDDNDNAGNGGSGLGEQILSSTFIDACA
ncbi:hypothetical protein HD806DRAFT_449167 [Xylariaceae sp. AK1471]|nr:hypothetical protein HD806DRAFT_449167 [Xylariaceae sp. AK1471]